VQALILDYDDDEDFTPESVEEWWGDVQHVAHTTRHHEMPKDKKPAIPRGRVVVALSRSITPDELGELATWVLAGGRGRPAEKELKTPARAYFVPVRTDGYWHAVHLTGRALDVDQVLASMRKPAEAETPEGADAWALLEKNDEGYPLRTPTNLDTILEHDSRWTGRVQRCEFTGRVLVHGEPLTDETETEIGLTVGRVYGLHYPEERIHRSVCAVAARHPTHPVREYLEGLTWDGVARLDHWLQDYVGCADDSGLTGRMGRFFMIAAVARVMQPGCQVHTVLVLQGKQGVGKSSAFRVLCGRQWFSDTGLDIRNKDAFQALRGRLMVEWGELDSLKRSEITAVKNFVTSAVDTYRPSYGRNVIEVPRQCVFVGTTNESVFLNDPTGARRFWVVETRYEVRLDRLEADRDQLWAEAVRAYKAGERWHLTQEEDALREADAGKYQHADPWQEAVAGWLTRNPGPCTATDVLLGALEKRPGDITRADEMRVATAMQALGRVRRRIAEGGVRSWRWVRP
jgi:putative DNA primase/helicase